MANESGAGSGGGEYGSASAQKNGGLRDLAETLDSIRKITGPIIWILLLIIGWSARETITTMNTTLTKLNDALTEQKQVTAALLASYGALDSKEKDTAERVRDLERFHREYAAKNGGNGGGGQR